MTTKQTHFIHHKRRALIQVWSDMQFWYFYVSWFESGRCIQRRALVSKAESWFTDFDEIIDGLIP